MRAPALLSFALPSLAFLAAAPAAAQTRAEVGARARAQFAAADRNRDGVLTRDEVARAVARRGMTTGQARIVTNQYFGRLDANRDGRVTRPELNRAVEQGFRRFDANGNGRIDPRERAAARAYLGNPAR